MLSLCTGCQSLIRALPGEMFMRVLYASTGFNGLRQGIAAFGEDGFEG